jgi:mono/diheme cytochrome c family protein
VAAKTLTYTILLLVLAVTASPVAAQPSGMDLYMNHCAACHGPAGEGDGPVATVMEIVVPNLRTLRERNGGDFPLDAVTAYIDGRESRAAHGTRQMPIWGDVFAARGDDESVQELVRARIDAIVAFVAQLQYSR